MRELDAVPDLPPWALVRREVAPALDRARAACRRARDRRDLAFERCVQANLSTSRVGRAAVPAAVHLRLGLLLGSGCATPLPPGPVGPMPAAPSAASRDAALRDWFGRGASMV